MAGRDLRVGGRGGQYLRIGDALAAAQDGDTVQIRAGTYVDDFGIVSHRISIVAIGGPVRLEATQPVPNGKGILIVRSDVTIDGLTFVGARVADLNGAGIRYEGGHMTIRNCVFANNENGILANSSPDGTISIERSEFARNGHGDGYSHGIYVNNVQSLRIADSYFHDTSVGHHIKSRAQATTVEGNRIDDGAGGTASYSIELPNGGIAVIRANTIIQTATSQNPAMIGYGAEGSVPPGSSLTIVGNRIENDLPGGVGVRNFSSVVAEIRDNVLVNLPTLAVGPNHQSGNQLGKRSLDLPDHGDGAPALAILAPDAREDAPDQGGLDGSRDVAADIALVGVSEGGSAAADVGGE